MGSCFILVLPDRIRSWMRPSSYVGRVQHKPLLHTAKMLVATLPARLETLLAVAAEGNEAYFSRVISNDSRACYSENEIRGKDRPHPGPLPQERGKPAQRLGIFTISGVAPSHEASRRLLLFNSLAVFQRGQSRPHCALWRKAWSTRTSAVIASTIGTARGSTQGS